MTFWPASLKKDDGSHYPMFRMEPAAKRTGSPEGVVSRARSLKSFTSFSSSCMNHFQCHSPTHLLIWRIIRVITQPNDMFDVRGEICG